MTICLRRREFMTVLGGAAAWPLAARAQQPAMPVVGFLNHSSPRTYASRVRAFRDGLSEAGFVEGRNVTIDYRWGEDNLDRLPVLVADLIRRPVSVIATPGSSAGALAAKAATATIPIVFFTGDDPVAGGLVRSLNRPGGNLTGVTNLTAEVGPKRLEIVHELLPTATVVALLVNPTEPSTEREIRDMQAAARLLGLQLHVLRATSEREFDVVFSAQLHASALVFSIAALFVNEAEQLAALAMRHGVPAIAANREFPAAGGLMSYGSSSNLYAYRMVGSYTGRILKGEKPADLPVQQATKVELTINMNTAKALGLSLPLTILGRADEVIE
jgi:putative ABC transport system substrate-binding protein